MPPTLLQIVLLGLIQGAAELLPVSSSAHVIAAEKLMHLDPSSPEVTFLLLMLHTGSMAAMIVYFWEGWKRSYFESAEATQKAAKGIAIATAATVGVGFGAKQVIEKLFMKGLPHAEVEQLFSNLPLIAASLALAGVLIIVAGLKVSSTSVAPVSLSASGLIG